MKNRFTQTRTSTFLIWILSLLSCYSLTAQNQAVATVCYTGPTQSFTATAGTAVGTVNFTQGNGPNQIPVGHRIVDVIVEVVWSKSDQGSCTGTTGQAADLSQVGFKLRKAGAPSLFLAASAGTAAFPAAGPTVASFSGSFPGNTTGILFDTISFRDGAPALLPASTPNTANDTFSTNNDPLSSLYGLDPTTFGGAWQLEAIDDAPGTGPALCVHSFCVTVVTCDPTSLQAICQTNVTVPLDNSGLVNLTFAQLDNGSNTSCILDNISFSRSNFGCADVGTTTSVDMTLTDRLGNTSTCSSNVTIADSTAPVITGCLPTVFDTLYLDTFGRDTFFASSLDITDNCGTPIKEVRPFSGGPWGSRVTFNCVNGFQRIWGRGTDLAGNVDSCQILLRVIDTIAPTAVCGSDTLYLATSGTTGRFEVTANAIGIDGGSFDVCPPITGRWIGSQFATPPTYTCADIGTQTVTLVVADNADNIDSCNTATITVLDTISPTAICQTDTVYLDNTGNGTAFAVNFDNNSVDSCGIDSVDFGGSAGGVTSLSYTCADAGSSPSVVVRVFDPSGNVDSCTTNVVVLDTIPPTAICRNRTAYLNAAGTVLLAADTFNNNSVDVCTGNNLTFEVGGNPTATFDCSNIGTNPITVSVIDANGNSATCTPTVTILDTVAPVANCATPTVYLNAAGVATVDATQLDNGSTDNCGIENYYVNTIGITSTNFNCNAINTPQNVTLIVEDTSGNTASCPTTVIVEDTISPTAICFTSITVTLDNSGAATVQPADIDSLSGDNCGAGISFLINGNNSQAYSCADVGSNTAILTVTDSAGTAATCSSTVIVRDNQPPIPGCQPATIFLNSSGVASLTPADVINPSATSDNCVSFTATFAGGATNINYNCDSVGGPRPVTVVITDNSGNQSSCSPNVTVRDTTPPTAICRSSYTVQLDSSGNGFVVPMNINNGSFDICGIDTMLVNGVDTFFYDCTNVGNTAAILTVVDSSGTTASCPTSVRVNDPIDPIARCFGDTTLYLDATGVVTANPTHIDSSSIDNCSNLSLTINGAPSVNYNCSNVGSNTAFLTVTDGSGNTDVCSSTINIVDTISPIANCTPTGSVTLFVPQGQCFQSAPASIFDNGSTDNCASSLTYTVGGTSTVTLTTLGVNPITLTVTDGNGQSATCTTDAILRDTVRPTMVCKNDTIQLDNNGSGIVLTTDINGGSSDNCGTPNYTINGQPSLPVDCNDLGLNTVTLIGSDASGNTDSCSAQVLVQDNIAPQARCFGTATLVLDPNTGTGVLTPADVDNGSTDNCTIASLSLSRTNYSCADIAFNPDTVTLFVLDQSGNLDSCQTRLTVRDTVDPVASCVAPITVYLNTTTVSITTSDIDNNSTDNCAIQSYALSQSTFNCSNVGPNTIILTVTDSSGNFATCQTTVNVEDSISPTPNCNNLTVQLDANGTVSVAAIDIAAGSFDNCIIDTILVNGADSVAYTCANIGNNVANIYIQDESGAFATCTAIITVEDNIAPTANCVSGPINLQLDINGIATLTPADVDNGSTDNCGTIASRTLSRDTFRCTDISNNPNTVTLTVTDADGNTATCTTPVNVNDTIAPTVICQADTVYLGASGVANVVAANFDNGSNDACGITSLTISGTNNPVGCVDIGTRNITLIATDANGNVDSCITTLTILDTVAPTLTCIDDTLNLGGFGNLTIDSNTTSIYNVTDACGTTALTLNGGTSVSYTCADLGPNNVTIEATDAGGNVSTCVAIVTVQDVTPPSPTCSNSATQYLDSNGQLAVDPTWLLSNVVEACGVDTVFAAPDSMDCSNVGNNNVTITVIDESGNQSSCSANLPILDTIPPTMVCRDTTVCLSGGFVNINAADIDGGTTDACGLSPSLTINGSNNVLYTCNDIGTQVAILERTDVNGNSDTCRATVTVEDCEAPSAVCRNFTAQLDSTGQVAVSALGDIEFGSNDDCGIDSTTFAINGQDTLTYNCSFLNTPDTVLFTVADNFGNIDSCTTIITIEDNIAPTARCASVVTRVLPGSGFVTIPAFNLNNNNTPSTDNCTISTYLINGKAIDTFDCSNLGFNTVVLSVIDQDGNVDTCQTQVEIQDLTNPNVNCVLNSSYVLDSTGVFLLPATTLVSSSSDNCGIASVLANGQDTLTLTCDSIGAPIQIQVAVVDSSGNTATCRSLINVTDTVSPVAICPTVPVQAYLTSAPSGATYIQANTIDSASFDNCGIISYLINGQDSALYSCANIGTIQNAVLTVEDASGLTATCNATIEVLDTIPPSAICRDIAVTLSPAGIAIVNSTAIDSASTDNCGISNFLINGQARDTFDCSNVGSPNNALLTVVDQYGNQSFCTSSITVFDNTPPTITCPGSPVNYYLNNNGVAVVDPRTVANASDTCSVIFWFINGQTLDTFDCSAVGTTQAVNIRVEDPSGNSANCTALLNILDTIPPTASCQGAITIALDSTGENNISYSDINLFSSDNCGIVDTLVNGQLNVTYTCDSVANSPLTAVMTLIDASGNSSSCQTTINLVDNIFPVARCKDTVFVQLDNTPNAGLAIVQAVSLDNGSSDACTPLSFLINNLPADTFRCQNVGNSNPRVLTVTDANGNSSTCISQIQVLDVNRPTAVCQPIDAYLNSSGRVTVSANQVDNGSFDNCAIIYTRFSDSSSTVNYTCADTGTHTVTLVVADFQGNVDSCQAVITVRDTVAPVANCQTGISLVIDLTTSGQQLLVPSDIGSGSDNCSVDSLWLSKDTITCTDIGMIPITLFVQDQNGNQSSCTDTITVTLDRPTIVLPTQDTVLCEGTDLPLSATVPPNGATYDYQWFGPQGAITFDPTTRDTTVFNVDGLDDGRYTFRIIPTNSNGCPAEDTININVNEVPPPVLAANTTCVGDSAIFYLVNTNSYNGTNITYEWQFNGSPYVPNPNDDTLVISPATAANNGNYTMRITVDGCVDSSVVPYAFNVIDLPTPPAPFTNLPCDGQPLTFFANPTDSTRFPYTYNWSSNTTPAFTSILPDPIRPNANQTFDGIYTVTVTDTNGCASSGSVTVSIRPTPTQPNIFYTQPLCVGDLLELQDTTNYTVPPLVYLWMRPDGTVDTTTTGQLFLNNASAGDYMLTVTSGGCASVPDTQNVQYEAIPVALDDNFTVKFRDSLVGGDIVINDVTNPNGFTTGLVGTSTNSTVLFNTDGTINYTPNGGFFGEDTVLYSLCDAQCPTSCDTAAIIVDVTTDFECFIPNGFSPNGDGVNDEVIIRCRNNYPSAEIEIFSRWGTRVYKGAPSGWNGQFDGADLPDGTYFYVLNLNDKTYVGNTKDKSQGRVGDRYTGFIILQR